MAQNPRPRRPWEEGAASTSPSLGPADLRPRPESQQSPFRPGPDLHALQIPPSSQPVLHQDPSSDSAAHAAFLRDGQGRHLVALHVVPPLNTRTPGLDFGSPSAISSKRRRLDHDVHPPRVDSFTAKLEPSPNDRHSCCAPGCLGPQCVAIRHLADTLRTEITTHEVLVHGSTAAQHHGHQVDRSTPLSDLIDITCGRLQQSNISLKKLLDGKTPKPNPQNRPDPSPPSHGRHDSTSIDRQGSKDPSDHSVRSTSITPADLLRSEQDSPSARLSARSRLHHPPPSPVSLNMSLPNMSLSIPPSPSIAAPTGPSTSFFAASASSTLLQDLQHQLAVKTLAYTTLSKEYDTLFQKLSRQRVKCATLERKFEVSDAEIISLSNEKERLEDKVDALERQLESVQVQRDDVLRAGEESKSQWLRIVDLAGKLHSGADQTGGDRAWVEERDRLRRRIEELEAGLVAGEDGGQAKDGEEGAGRARSRAAWLENEVEKLRERNARLESGAAAAKQAALTLAAHGQNVGAVLNKALGEA